MCRSLISTENHFSKYAKASSLSEEKKKTGKRTRSKGLKCFFFIVNSFCSYKTIENFKKFVKRDDMLYKLKLHFLSSHLDYFPKNLTVSMKNDAIYFTKTLESSKSATRANIGLPHNRELLLQLMKRIFRCSPKKIFKNKVLKFLMNVHVYFSANIELCYVSFLNSQIWIVETHSRGW